MLATRCDDVRVCARVILMTLSWVDTREHDAEHCATGADSKYTRRAHIPITSYVYIYIYISSHICIPVATVVQVVPRSVDLLGKVISCDSFSAELRRLQTLYVLYLFLGHLYIGWLYIYLVA